jgi:hypothetical protein
VNSFNTIAFFSRHTPPAPLQAALADYRIVQVNPAGRAFGPGDAWRCIAARCGFPHAVIIVMPWHWKHQFCKHLYRLHAPTQVLEMVMMPHDEAAWSGRIKQIVYTPGRALEFREWTP